MASLKFRIKGSSVKKAVSIYLRMSISRDLTLEVKTGFNIQPESWSETTRMPKQNTPELKNLFNDLKRLESFVFDKLNEVQKKGLTIDKFWLENVVISCFARKIKEIEYRVTDHITYIIENSSTKKVNGRNNLGLTISRVNGYKSFKMNFEEFERFNQKHIELTDLNPSLIEKYKNWLLKHKKFSLNYAGKQLDNLRAVANDASRIGITVHTYATKLESFSESDEDRIIVTFSFSELTKIKNAKMPTEYLENAKKWLLLGCEIGQRGGDLLSITKDNLRLVGDCLFIDILQQKTKKQVTIPIGSKHIRQMLENDFPRTISQQKLNDYIKTVCEWAGITEATEGKIFSKELKRKISGCFPKYQLVTSHSFRRSFATNYYKKIATPILMTITGHSKESIFLKYINKQEDRDDNARLFLQYYKELNI